MAKEQKQSINELTIGVQGRSDEVGARTERGGQRQREWKISVADKQDALSRGVMRHPSLSCCRLLHPKRRLLDCGVCVRVCSSRLGSESKWFGVWMLGGETERSRAAGLLICPSEHRMSLLGSSHGASATGWASSAPQMVSLFTWCHWLYIVLGCSSFYLFSFYLFPFPFL